jgi:hypothetical protein
MRDELARIERMVHQTELDMDLGEIFDQEYKAIMAEELADQVRAEARKQAQADILVRRRAKKDVSV